MSRIVARRLKGLRAEIGLSQEQAATLLGISYGTYRRIESRDYAIDLEQFLAILEAFELEGDRATEFFKEVYDEAIDDLGDHGTPAYATQPISDVTISEISQLMKGARDLPNDGGVADYTMRLREDHERLLDDLDFMTALANDTSEPPEARKNLKARVRELEKRRRERESYMPPDMVESIVEARLRRELDEGAVSHLSVPIAAEDDDPDDQMGEHHNDGA